MNMIMTTTKGRSTMSNDRGRGRQPIAVLIGLEASTILPLLLITLAAMSKKLSVRPAPPAVPSRP
jgi:hypothetical protein